jgi:long-chain-fatty-acid--[acyl-carrier-protein] ligase
MAIESEENDKWVKLTLFTTQNVNTKVVNNYLHEQWVTNLVSIDEIIKLEEIPMLGTWKVDHVQLKSILAQWTTEQPRKTTTKTKKETSKKIKK